MAQNSVNLNIIYRSNCGTYRYGGEGELGFQDGGGSLARSLHSGEGQGMKADPARHLWPSCKSKSYPDCQLVMGGEVWG